MKHVNEYGISVDMPVWNIDIRLDDEITLDSTRKLLVNFVSIYRQYESIDENELLLIMVNSNYYERKAQRIIEYIERSAERHEDKTHVDAIDHVATMQQHATRNRNEIASNQTDLFT